MSYLKESPTWEDGIYQIETSDPVLGGPEGITNRPPRELANRTAWLKQQLEGTQAALEAHANSRNHPDATLAAKGFVQLSNATYSQDETTAATPKLVNARVNAIVDNAPSDLDTLNKLAQAISNNPKFAESVTQLLSQKLAKNENGADIPDKNQFIKNLGLLEPRFSTFFNGGVFAVPEGITTVYVSGCGAGGGGGGGLGYLNGYTSGGGGGGAGKAVIREAVKVTPGEQITITIGRGGKGGAGGASNNSGIKGENGGLTALGDLLMLPGGDGGPPGIGGTNGYGGAGYPYGETAIGGNLNGMSTFYMVAASGASCAFGGGGPGGHVGSQGAHHARPAYGYGAGGGGGGGTRISGTAGGNGGDGANGWLTIEW
ncbi:phage tail protein [Arsenophonus endosymbiont of Crataerina pallida]|uniref:phage tail protein n=1 Tax=Arsenophonus endosymbiont of Crataerina pallida TaxID=3066235 RepID=UPI0030CCDC4A